MAYTPDHLRSFVERIIRQSAADPELKSIACEDIAFQSGVERELALIFGGSATGEPIFEDGVETRFGLSSATEFLRYVAILWATHRVVKAGTAHKWREELERMGLPPSEAKAVVDKFMSDLASLV